MKPIGISLKQNLEETSGDANGYCDVGDAIIYKVDEITCLVLTEQAQKRHKDFIQNVWLNMKNSTIL